MYKVGLHDAGGIAWMLDHGQRGIALDHVSVSDQPLTLDYNQAQAAGIAVVVRLNYGYADGTGTLPPPDKLAAFERAIVATMKAAQGVAYFQYANEVNNPAEWPDGFALTPDYYIDSYNRVWWQTPINVYLGPSPIDPYFGPDSNNREWWLAILNGIGGADVLFLHPKTQTNDPGEIESCEKFSNEPLTWQCLHFRTIETSLEIVPERLRSKPVILSEVNPQRIDTRRFGWKRENIEWVKRCKAYVQAWNAVSDHQQIEGIIFYRWCDDDWRLDDKPKLLAEIFREHSDARA